MRIYLGPPVIRANADSLTVELLVCINVRSNMRFFIFLVTLFHTRSDGMKRDGFLNFGHDGKTKRSVNLLVWWVTNSY
jgi:hypothetical protein